MYINKTDSSNINILPQGGQPDRGVRATAADCPILSVNTDTEGYTKKALSMSPESAKTAIEEAKTLLAAGLLDTPDAVRQAAFTIAIRGI
jgi:hypothetical protein